MREAAPNTGASASRLAALNLLVFAPIGVQLPFLPLWYASIGFAAESIALIQGATPIARFLANLLVPPLADRKGAAARLLALCGLGMTVVSLCAGLVQPAYTLVFICIVASAFGQGPMIALTDAIVLREARRRVVAGERPLDYGVVRGAGSVSVLLLMMAGGWFVGLFPPDTMIFVISGVMALAAAGVFLLAPKDSRANGDGATVKLEKIARPRVVIFVVLGGALIQASHAVVYTFGSIAFRAQGHSDLMIGLLWAVGVATEIAFFLASNRFGGASRAYGLLIAGALFAILRWLVMASTTSVTLVFLAQALHAFSFAATHLGSIFALTRLVGETRRAQAQGWISGANALSTALVSVVSGHLWKAYGLHAYLFMCGVAALGLGLALAAALDPRRDD
ncbi:MAG: MFS transporter [Methylobacteriaceae bacterium]|nr:MFS transporter [Rhodoblastus sp.]MCC0005272.1 MFS transporter [Methylobacteriaceae bacterium]